MLRLVCLLTLATAVPAAAAPHRKHPARRAAGRAKAPRRPLAPAPPRAIAHLGQGYRHYLDGNYLAAARALARIRPERMQNPDYVLYLLGQSELLAGHPKEARAHFARLAELAGRFGTVARWRLADADWEAGHLEAARKEYEAALSSASDAVEPALAHFRIGEALAKKGDTAAAQRQWRKVYVESPMYPLAAQALTRLTETKAPPITPEEHIARAKSMLGERAWDEALAELAAVPVGAAQAVRDEADYWLGTAQYRTRHAYAAAAKQLLGVWARLPGDDRKAEALFHGARALSRADHDDDAQAGYRQVVARFPRSKYAAEASFLIGWLDFNRGRYKQAIPELQETLSRYGGAGGDARWYLGYSRWLLGDAKAALGDFEVLAKSSGALSGGKGAYWRGRALVQLGRREEAQKAFRALAESYPFSYYAQLARLRLAELGIKVGPWGSGAKGAPPALSALDDKLAEDGLIRRVDELLRAGLSVEAGVELRRGESDFVRHYGTSRALPVLFDRYHQAENFNRPHQLAQSYGGGALKLDPQDSPVVRRWWELIYPRAYRQYVEKYAATGSVSPYYLYSIMQKESAYNPHDVSYANALGLLQMIPPTSKRVGEAIGVPYTEDVLFDPEGNIRFGAWYIGHLLAKFKEQVALGAGSYNAGPRAMMKWIGTNGKRPLDEFVELTPYTQTREYMKKVLEIYARYLWLYEKKDYLPSLKIDAAYITDDHIDY